MNKDDVLFTDAGTKRILNRFKLNPKFYSAVRESVDSLLSHTVKSRECYQYRYFLTSLSNMYMFRLATLIRNKLGSQEEEQIMLFGRLLKKKVLPELQDDYIRELTNDFAQHIFYDFISDKSNKNWTPHVSNIPVTFLKTVNPCSVNIYDLDG